MNSQVDGAPLEEHLQKICKSFITLIADEKRMSTEHFNRVYKYVTDNMGDIDILFSKIFQRQQLAGSYADRIKVGKPNEYDALMILKFPDPVPKKIKPGYVTINIKEGLKKWNNIDEQKYNKLIDKDGYLLQDKVFEWLRKLIQETLTKCNNVIKVNNNHYAVVKQSTSGPAITLDVQVQKAVDGYAGTFSIDFVGALAFDYNDVWFGNRKPPLVNTKYWNAIPKPNKLKQHDNREWICSYADIEREYLKNTQSLKQLIRIFKKIRDTHNLTNLKSYYIKVIFIHQRLEQDHKYWSKSMGVLFMEMFKVILKHLETGKLMSVWHNDYNLLGQLKPEQIKDIYNKLKKIKENIDKNLINKNPEFIRSVILSSNEMGLSTNQETCQSNTSTKNCNLM